MEFNYVLLISCGAEGKRKSWIAIAEKKGYCKGKGDMRVSTTGKRYTEREKGESKNL